MTEYTIERFDAILNKGTSNTKFPAIYIKPDAEFLEFAKKNNYLIGCKIKNSGTVYDDKVLSGILNNKLLDRPNFLNQSGLCVIMLLVKWKGYPEYGRTPSVTFFEIKRQNDQESLQADTNYNETPQTKTNYVKNNSLQNNTNTNSTLKIILPTITFLVFLLIVYFLKIRI
jgi:hypothetical protein